MSLRDSTKSRPGVGHGPARACFLSGQSVCDCMMSTGNSCLLDIQGFNTSRLPARCLLIFQHGLPDERWQTRILLPAVSGARQRGHRSSRCVQIQGRPVQVPPKHSMWSYRQEMPGRMDDVPRQHSSSRAGDHSCMPWWMHGH